MTILAMYRWGDKAVFASDFRISFLAGNQVDVISKFVPFEKKLGIFTAGDVDLWKGAVPIIESVMHEITIDNVVQQDGPLQLALQRYTEAVPTARDKPKPCYGGIGIMVDEDKGINSVFSLDGEASSGLRIAPLEDGCIVMGSGRQIPMIQENLSKLLDKHIAERPYNLPEVESVLEGAILNLISQCGASAYRKLGISPVLATSRLSEGGFKMTGFETEGSYISTYESRRDYHYSFERINEQLMLQDHLNGKTFVVNEIVHFSDTEDDELFDPKGLADRFDPCPYSVGNTVYFMNQWVEDDFIDQTVYKTGIFYFKGQSLCNPNYEQLAYHKLENPEKSVKELYRNTGYIGLKIHAEKCSSFEAGIQKQIQSHEWMAEHITNYDELNRM